MARRTYRQRTSHSNRRRVLRIEPLESRNLLAVTASIANQILTVTGDDTANEIVVTTATFGTGVVVPYVTEHGSEVPITGGLVSTSLINGLVIAGNEGSDLINAAGVAPGGGWDLTPVGGGPQRVYIAGGYGDDTILGSEFPDGIDGEFGEDKLYGRNGNDTINGGPNSDPIMEGNDGDDELNGQGGNDTMYGNDGLDHLNGGTEGDRLFGGNHKDSLFGGAGDDKLYAGEGCDTLQGDAGTDELLGEYGDDTLDDPDGNGGLDGGTGRDKTNGVFDNDESEGCYPGINVFVDPELNKTSEWGGSVAFVVKLTGKPNADVTMQLWSLDTTEGAATTNGVTFTPTNWSQPKTVLVNGVNDSIDDGTIAYQIQLDSLVSTDQRFNGIVPPNVQLFNLDDDCLAKPDQKSTPEDEAIIIDALENDTDEGGDLSQLRIVYVGPSINGLGTPELSGSVIQYTPDPNKNGDDKFLYTIENEHGKHSTTEVKVKIEKKNDQPMGNSLGESTLEDTPVSFALSGDDGDPMPGENQTLTFAIVADPAHGQITSFNPSTGAGTYLPAPNYNNTGEEGDLDSFLFTVTDDNTAGGAALTSAAVSVTIRVLPVNDAPTAVDNQYDIYNPGSPVTIDVVSDDFDIENDELTITAVTQGSLGAVAPNGASVTYSPNDQLWTPQSSDTFTYTISDGHGGYDTASVTIRPSGSWGLALFSSTTQRSLHGPSAAGSEGFSIAGLDQIAPLVAEARSRLARAGFDTSVLDALRIQVANLDGNWLGRTWGGVITIDRDAAGAGWFLDATPRGDSEFHRHRDELWARHGNDAYGHVDLLTVMMHEMSHVLGLEHAEHGLMDDTLGVGVRRTPDDLALMLALGQPLEKQRVVALVFSDDLLD